MQLILLYKNSPADLDDDDDATDLDDDNDYATDLDDNDGATDLDVYNNNVAEQDKDDPNIDDYNYHVADLDDDYNYVADLMIIMMMQLIIIMIPINSLFIPIRHIETHSPCL